MKHKKFDYYIFIDFSENLIGYNIINSEKMLELLPKISKIAHYKNLRHKKEYLNSVKRRIETNKILSYFVKYKIRELYRNADIYTDVLDFIKRHENCIIFISIDNRQFKAFRKLVGYVDGEKVVVKRESELIKGTPEYQTSLVLDTLLNIERNKR
jgi:replicative superfamily II helicase